ncbi:MAG: DUF4276 family protein [Treponema sp.]|nr:DUF4276 family protein [Treponema sp.]
MRLVFMVEELSMKALLEIILPKILPTGFEKPLIIAHNGKSDLARSIPRKLQGWQSSDDRFIIVHDQDSNDCVQLKNSLQSLCKSTRNDCLVRIVCDELESWYFGDLKAVSLAYGKDYTPLAVKRKYRVPDRVMNAKEEFNKLVPVHQPIGGARKIASFMDVNNNTSHSFNVFIKGVRKMCHVSTTGA